MPLDSYAALTPRQAASAIAWRGCRYFCSKFCDLGEYEIAKEWHELGERHVRPYIYNEPYPEETQDAA